MAIRLVVGLGNPGSRYERTRHNVGFRIVHLLTHPNSWSAWRRADLGDYARAGFSDDVYVVRPRTYMNLSGQMVQDFAHFYKIQPPEILACYDDIDLSLGRLRLRLKGSAGGHHGMKSIIESMGTQDIPRLRVGIGPVPPHMDAEDFVLQKTNAAEETLLESSILSAANAVEEAWKNGVESAMNKYNPPGKELE